MKFLNVLPALCALLALTDAATVPKGGSSGKGDKGKGKGKDTAPTKYYEAANKFHSLGTTGGYAFYWDKKATTKSEYGPPMDTLVAAHNNIEHRSLVVGLVGTDPSGALDFYAFVCELGFNEKPAGKTEKDINAAKASGKCTQWDGRGTLTPKGPVSKLPTTRTQVKGHLDRQAMSLGGTHYNLQSNNCYLFADKLYNALA